MTFKYKKKTKVPACTINNHVDGESCVDKCSVSCSKDCPCCNGSELRYLNNINGRPVYADEKMINAAIEEGLVEIIQQVENGYWVPITKKEWFLDQE